MTRRVATAVALFACLLFAAACGVVSTVSGGPTRYTLVLLKTGDAKDVSPESRRLAGQGHFSNMERLAREKKLLVAGPYGRVRSDNSLRGIFILDTDDRQQAEEWASTDPCFLAGIFKLEYHDFATTAPLREFLQAVAEREARFEAEGKKPRPGENARSYVWLTAESTLAMEVASAVGDDVLLMAGTSSDKAMLLLDAADVAAARELLQRARVDFTAIELDDWFASDLLAELGSLSSTD